MQYPGGKNGSGTYQSIINQVPPHNIYVELFAGSAGIYRIKKRSDISILCDIDTAAIAQIKPFVSPADILLNCDAISSLSLVCSILGLLNSFGHTVFMYLDPPYLFSTRKSQKQLYNFELTKEDHIAILSGISSQNFFIAISSYQNVLYNEYLKNWRRVDFKSTTRHGQVIESLYCNYPELSHLHDYSFIGDTFRQREAYSRMLKNTSSKINNLDPVAKSALLELIRNF